MEGKDAKSCAVWISHHVADRNMVHGIQAHNAYLGWAFHHLSRGGGAEAAHFSQGYVCHSADLDPLYGISGELSLGWKQGGNRTWNFERNLGARPVLLFEEAENRAHGDSPTMDVLSNPVYRCLYDGTGIQLRVCQRAAHPQFPPVLSPMASPRSSVRLWGRFFDRAIIDLMEEACNDADDGHVAAAPAFL